MATRALRLAQILRTTPYLPASGEFTEFEIAAAFALTNESETAGNGSSSKRLSDRIADIGGFANKYSGARLRR